LEAILYQIVYEKLPSDRNNSVSIRQTAPNLCFLESLRLMCLSTSPKPNLKMIANLFAFETKIQEIMRWRSVQPKRVVDLCENETSMLMRAFYAEALMHTNSTRGKQIFEEILSKKPQFQGDFIARGIAYAKAGSHKEACECFTKEQSKHIAQFLMGESQYRLKNFVEAARWYKLAADQGNSCAQNNLGYCYVKGEGVQKNFVEAFKYQKLSAENANSSGQNELGVLYYNGYGCSKNESEAIRWYTMSAEQGNSWGQNNLGYCYFHGIGVTKNLFDAFKWFQRSADQGNQASQENLKKLKALDKNL